jgi:hypothetical protein
MENYNKEMELTGVNLEDVAVQSLEEVDFNAMDPEQILQETGKEALKAAGLIAAGLVVTHVTCKYIVPFAVKKVKEFKEKREQAKTEPELPMDNENDEE